MRLLKINLIALEDAFETSSPEMRHYLDVETGEVLVVTDEFRLTDDLDLAPLAKTARQLNGRAMQTGRSRGGEVFLADAGGELYWPGMSVEGVRPWNPLELRCTALRPEALSPRRSARHQT